VGILSRCYLILWEEIILDLDKKITIVNLCNWKISFARLNSVGDVLIPPKGKMRIDAGEVVSQCFAGNKLFMGEDRDGAHARIFIDDKDTRIEVGLELPEEDSKQLIFTDEDAKKLFELKTLAAFKRNVQEKVVSHAEKNLLAEYAKKNNINDYDKLKFIKEYTGFPID